MYVYHVGIVCINIYSMYICMHHAYEHTCILSYVPVFAYLYTYTFSFFHHRYRSVTDTVVTPVMLCSSNSFFLFSFFLFPGVEIAIAEISFTIVGASLPVTKNNRK